MAMGGGEQPRQAPERHQRHAAGGRLPRPPHHLHGRHPAPPEGDRGAAPDDRQPRQEARERQPEAADGRAGRRPRRTTSRRSKLSKAGRPEAPGRALPEVAQSAEIIIKADQRLKYGDVKEVMKMAKEAGFQNVGLIADKKQKGDRRRADAPRTGITGDTCSDGSRRRIRRLQERHQHHAARGRRAGAADHLHGHHAPAADGLRRQGPAQGHVWISRSPLVDQVIVSLTPQNQIFLNKQQVTPQQLAQQLADILKNRR